MTDVQRAKLQSACDYVANGLRMKLTPVEIIAGLQREHGATFEQRYDRNKLRCAGVAANCTWSADQGLLDNWRKTATTRLMVSA
jgi:hypothetical protein